MKLYNNPAVGLSICPGITIGQNYGLMESCTRLAWAWRWSPQWKKKIKKRAPMGGSLYQFRTEDLLALERILDAADGVLNLALYLIGLAFAFRLLVAGHLPNDFFHFAFPLFQGTFHAVSVDHKVTPQCGVSQRERADLPERSIRYQERGRRELRGRRTVVMTDSALVSRMGSAASLLARVPVLPSRRARHS